MVNFFATVPVCVNSSRYGGGREGKGGGGCLCVCDHPRQRRSGKGLFMMSVIDILSGSLDDST